MQNFPSTPKCPHPCGCETVDVRVGTQKTHNKYEVDDGDGQDQKRPVQGPGEPVRNGIVTMEIPPGAGTAAGNCSCGDIHFDNLLFCLYNFR